MHYGEAGERLLTGMRAAVNALLATGNNVILDEMPVDDSIMPAWRRDLRAAATFWVRLTASLPVLEQGERARTKGQQLGNSRGHFDVQAGDDWNLIIDTDDLTPSETAARDPEGAGRRRLTAQS
ncbi:MAG: phosphotransferase-like protein [Intrasporangium sp.]|uniref:phosphotransferase-like protein n=1 Tax=Intrasporangium sp. TaxID=1925024 RepID=UPI003F7F7897